MCNCFRFQSIDDWLEIVKILSRLIVDWLILEQDHHQTGTLLYFPGIILKLAGATEYKILSISNLMKPDATDNDDHEDWEDDDPDQDGDYHVCRIGWKNKKKYFYL